MAKYFLIDSPIYGGLGSKTIMDTNSVPVVPFRLNYALDAVPQSDLFKGPRCYIVNKKLSEAIELAHLSGVQLAEVMITLSPTFLELHSNAPVGDFVWLKISGRAGANDFGLDAYHRIVVSEGALKVLKDFNLSECHIYDYVNSPRPEEQLERILFEAKAKKNLPIDGR